MSKFKSKGQAQRFLSCYGVVNNLFRLGRHLMKASNRVGDWTIDSIIIDKEE